MQEQQDFHRRSSKNIVVSSNAVVSDGRAPSLTQKDDNHPMGSSVRCRVEMMVVGKSNGFQ